MQMFHSVAFITAKRDINVVILIHNYRQNKENKTTLNTILIEKNPCCYYRNLFLTEMLFKKINDERLMTFYKIIYTFETKTT